MSFPSPFGSFLSSLAGSRGCPFDVRADDVEAAIVCHELRCVDHVLGEKIQISFRYTDCRQNQLEQYAAVNELCKMKSLRVDSVVVMQVWAVYEDAFGTSMPKRRACGELRIPIERLASKCNGGLYHTWLTLESTGLQESVSSMGFANTDVAEGFDQALINGPRQLFQPKACITICKVSDLGPDSKAIWTADMPHDARILRWGALVRSQEQHVLMCKAQHCYSQQAHGEKAGQIIEALEDRVRGQERETALLKAELARERAESLHDVEPLEVETTNHYGIDFNHMRAQVEETEAELRNVTDEANSKIDNANNIIRSLRRERDDANDKIERLINEKNALLEGRDRVLEENKMLLEDYDKLTKQKEALLKIVEDIHQHHHNFQLMAGGRNSIDSVTYDIQ